MPVLVNQLPLVRHVVQSTCAGAPAAIGVAGGDVCR